MTDIPVSCVTFFCEYRGPFAHSRARTAYNRLDRRTNGFIASWTRFSWDDPKSWFFSRVEAVSLEDPRGLEHASGVLQSALGWRKLFWRYTHPISVASYCG